MKRIRLAQRRKAVVLSQERLAEMLSVDPSTIRRWERADNDPQPWHRPKLAQALRVSIDELVLLLADLSDGHAAIRDLAIPATRSQDGDVDRRSLLPLAALPVVGGLGAIVELLTPVGWLIPQPGSELTIVQAEVLTGRAKTLYQDCQYQKALAVAPGLVAGLGQLAGVANEGSSNTCSDCWQIRITSLPASCSNSVTRS